MAGLAWVVQGVKVPQSISSLPPHQRARQGCCETSRTTASASLARAARVAFDRGGSLSIPLLERKKSCQTRMPKRLQVR